MNRHQNSTDHSCSESQFTKLMTNTFLPGYVGQQEGGAAGLLLRGGGGAYGAAFLQNLSLNAMCFPEKERVTCRDGKCFSGKSSSPACCSLERDGFPLTKVFEGMLKVSGKRTEY